MFKFLIISLLHILPVVLGFPKNYIADDERIIHGSPAFIKDHPYFASLGRCGASILSDRWLLTAAHCIPASTGVAYVGGETLYNSIRVNIQTIIEHPQYNVPSNLNNDIALVYLSQPLIFTDKIQPINLPATWSSPLRPYLLVGRGRDETGQASTTIMKLNLQELSTQQCPRPDYDQATLGQNFICATRYDPQNPDYRPTACFGDSGSGLIQDNTVVGVTSAIYDGDCLINPLTYFARVSTYVPWIKSVTGL